MTDTPAAPAPVDVWAMTPDEATAALAAMNAVVNPLPPLVPQDAQDARATLERLSRDKSWADALFNGNVATRKQFDELVAKAAGGDDTADAVAGVVELAVPLLGDGRRRGLARRGDDRGPESQRPRQRKYFPSDQSPAHFPRRVHGRAGV